MAQNAVRASEATVADTFSEVRSSCDQLPFMVSQNPYITAKTANSQNAAGSRARRPAGACRPRPGRPGLGPKGSRRLASSRAATATAASTGSPTQKPRPTKIATNTGASAVPSPSSALSPSTERSTAPGWNAAVNVLIDGTVSPNPAPRQPVATRSSG